MKETIMYCHEFDRHDGSKFYTHFYLHPHATKMCGDKPILKARIREIQEGEESSYWAWWDLQTEDPKFVYCQPSKIQFKMCFACGLEATEKAGKGVGVNVTIEIIEVMKDA